MDPSRMRRALHQRGQGGVDHVSMAPTLKRLGRMILFMRRPDLFAKERWRTQDIPQMLQIVSSVELRGGNRTVVGN